MDDDELTPEEEEYVKKEAAELYDSIINILALGNKRLRFKTYWRLWRKGLGIRNIIGLVFWRSFLDFGCWIMGKEKGRIKIKAKLEEMKKQKEEESDE